jgi:hypothetical protein
MYVYYVCAKSNAHRIQPVGLTEESKWLSYERGGAGNIIKLEAQMKE